MEVFKNKYFIIVAGFLFIVIVILSWMYYSESKKNDMYEYSLELGIASSVSDFISLLETMEERENYSDDAVSAWSQRQVAIEKSIQAISYRINYENYKNLTQEEYDTLSSMQETFRQLSYMFQRIPNTVSDPNTSFSPSSCSSVNLSTEADIKKRIGEYY
ncbi:hypothetical protein, partial [Gracilibacillus alcaliphilus]